MTAGSWLVSGFVDVCVCGFVCVSVGTCAWERDGSYVYEGSSLSRYGGKLCHGNGP